MRPAPRIRKVRRTDSRVEHAKLLSRDFEAREREDARSGLPLDREDMVYQEGRVRWRREAAEKRQAADRAASEAARAVRCAAAARASGSAGSSEGAWLAEEAERLAAAASAAANAAEEAAAVAEADKYGLLALVEATEGAVGGGVADAGPEKARSGVVADLLALATAIECGSVDWRALPSVAALAASLGLP